MKCISLISSCLSMLVGARVPRARGRATLPVGTSPRAVRGGRIERRKRGGEDEEYAFHC